MQPVPSAGKRAPDKHARFSVAYDSLKYVQFGQSKQHDLKKTY